MSELRIIDCEQHVLAPKLQDLMPYVVDDGWRRQLMDGEFELPPATPHQSMQIEERNVEIPATPAELVAGLQDNVEAAVLVAPQALTTSAWLSHTTAATFVSAFNDYVADVWVGADPRLRFAMSVSVHDPEIAAQEIRRVGSNPAVVAVAMPLMAVNMGQTTQHAIYDAATEVGLPIIVHHAGSEGIVVGPAVLSGVGPRTPEENFSLLPQIASANIGSLIFEGTFESYPKLKVLFQGFGFGWVAPLLWKADSEWRNLRHEVPWVKRPPSEYILEHIRIAFDGSELMDQHAKTMTPVIPDRILVYGSDRPYTTETAAERLASFEPELQERIAYGNALETFGESLVGAPA
jgi:predicted TIM-barrel fold metal-dependent hydrolase